MFNINKSTMIKIISFFKIIDWKKNDTVIEKMEKELNDWYEQTTKEYNDIMKVKILISRLLSLLTFY